MVEQFREAVGERELLIVFSLFGLLLQRLALDGAVGDDLDMIQIEWLGDEIARAQFHRLDRHVHGGISGHHDDVEIGLQILRLAEELHAIHARHPDVAKDKVIIIVLYP